MKNKIAALLCTKEDTGLRLRWRQLNSLTLVHLRGCLCEVRDPFKALRCAGQTHFPRPSPIGWSQPRKLRPLALFAKGQGRSARANNGTGGPKATPWLGGAWVIAAFSEAMVRDARTLGNWAGGR